MQIKKDHVKEAILKAGETEFLANGFEKSSIRKIVKKAGTTTGNFYNYFKNKEVLFDTIINDDLKLFHHYIENHNEGIPNIIVHSTKIEIRMQIESELDRFIPDFGIGLVLIMEHSDGTKYMTHRKKLMSHIKNHMYKHMMSLNALETVVSYSDVLAEQFVKGLTVIIKNYDNKLKKREMILEHIMFYIVGITGIAT